MWPQRDEVYVAPEGRGLRGPRRTRSTWPQKDEVYVAPEGRGLRGPRGTRSYLKVTAPELRHSCSPAVTVSKQRTVNICYESLTDLEIPRIGFGLEKDPKC